YFDPTAGSAQDLSVEVAGLGGESFVKAEARSRWYYTFLHSKTFGGFTYSLGSDLPHGVGNTRINGNQPPLLQPHLPGRITSIRGFQPRTLGPFESKKNTRGEIFSTTPVGGTSQIILNNEVIFPIVQGIGLKGVVFIDAGNAYGGDQNNIIDDARYSAGGG